MCLEELRTPDIVAFLFYLLAGFFVFVFFPMNLHGVLLMRKKEAKQFRERTTTHNRPGGGSQMPGPFSDLNRSLEAPRKRGKEPTVFKEQKRTHCG